MHTNGAYILTLCSAKGGSGTSVCSALIASALANRGLKTLVIEFSSGPGSIDCATGIYGNVVYDLGDIFTQQCNIEKAVCQSPHSNLLSVICSARGNVNINPQIFYNMLNEVKNSYNIIILDVASGYSLPFRCACAVSNAAVIVTNPNSVALRANQLIADTLCEYSHITTKLLINKVTQNMHSGNIYDLDECIDTVGVPLLGVIPESSDILNTACTGKALLESSAIASAFRAVAARICGVHAELIYK